MYATRTNLRYCLILFFLTTVSCSTLQSLTTEQKFSISEPSPQIQYSPTVAFTPTIEPTPLGGGSNVIIISTFECTDDPFRPQATGARKIDLSMNTKENIIEDGGKVEAVSPDQNQLLVIKDNILMITDINGIEVTRISESIPTDDLSLAHFLQAGWLSDGSKIFFISRESESNQKVLYLTNPDGSETIQLTKAGMQPLEVHPSSDLNGIYWEKGQFNENDHAFHSSGYQYTDLKGNNKKISQMELLLSPDNLKKAYSDYYFSGNNVELFSALSDMDGSNAIDLFGPKSKETQIVDLWNQYSVFSFPMLWSPDGSKLLIRTGMKDKDNSYFTSYQVFDITGSLLADDLPITEFVAWSPDSNYLVYYDPVEQNIQIYDLIHRQIVFTSESIYSCTPRLFWLDQ